MCVNNFQHKGWGWVFYIISFPTFQPQNYFLYLIALHIFVNQSHPKRPFLLFYRYTKLNPLCPNYKTCKWKKQFLHIMKEGIANNNKTPSKVIQKNYWFYRIDFIKTKKPKRQKTFPENMLNFPILKSGVRSNLHIIF